MFRLVSLTFEGSFRGTHEQEHHLHESPPSMTAPLVILAAAGLHPGAVEAAQAAGLTRDAGLSALSDELIGAVINAVWLFVGLRRAGWYVPASKRSMSRGKAVPPGLQSRPSARAAMMR